MGAKDRHLRNGRNGAGASKVVKTLNAGRNPRGLSPTTWTTRCNSLCFSTFRRLGPSWLSGGPARRGHDHDQHEPTGLKMKLLGSPAYGIADSLKLAKDSR